MPFGVTDGRAAAGIPIEIITRENPMYRDRFARGAKRDDREETMSTTR